VNWGSHLGDFTGGNELGEIGGLGGRGWLGYEESGGRYGRLLRPVNSWTLQISPD
ncbi:hypothetical protein FCV25MIE_05875, partial [Fagus crenata]